MEEKLNNYKYISRIGDNRQAGSKEKRKEAKRGKVGVYTENKENMRGRKKRRYYNVDAAVEVMWL